MAKSKLIELFTIRTGMLIVAKTGKGVKVEWKTATGERRETSLTWQEVAEAV